MGVALLLLLVACQLPGRPIPGAPVVAGDHGSDPSHPDMHGIFYAAGPGITPGRVLGAVEQVDVYALMCQLLGIQPPRTTECGSAFPALSPRDDG